MPSATSYSAAYGSYSSQQFTPAAPMNIRSSAGSYVTSNPIQDVNWLRRSDYAVEQPTSYLSDEDLNFWDHDEDDVRSVTSSSSVSSSVSPYQSHQQYQYHAAPQVETAEQRRAAYRLVVEQERERRASESKTAGKTTHRRPSFGPRTSSKKSTARPRHSSMTPIREQQQ